MKEDMLLGIKATVLGVLGVLTSLWGWFGWLVLVWCGLMLLDWLVGVRIAKKTGTWSSQKARDGAWHKGGMVLVFVVALVADFLMGTILENIPGVPLPFDYSVLFAPLVVVWYIVGELGSLAEHAVSVGAPVPPWLLRALAVGQRAIDAAGEAVLPDESKGQLPQENMDAGETPAEKEN